MRCIPLSLHHLRTCVLLCIVVTFVLMILSSYRGFLPFLSVLRYRQTGDGLQKSTRGRPWDPVLPQTAEDDPGTSGGMNLSSDHRQSENATKIGESGEPYAEREELREAYKRSPCSGLKHYTVSSTPLFPPCLPSIPPGIATWGKYPYIGPFNYTKRSKNPCFYNEKGTLRCIPYFFLAGFGKCGSTDFYFRLSEHPQVEVHEKEPSYFARKRFGLYQDFRYLSWDKYLDIFQKLAKSVQKDMKSIGYSKKITGDSSIIAINEVFEWPVLSGNEGCTEPRVINAHHIRHLNPDIRVMIIMRHPVQRLYSRFLFDYERPFFYDYHRRKKVNRRARNPRKFHEFVVDGLKKYQACFQRFSLRHCIYNITLWETVHGLKIQDSMYSVLLEDWLRVIPRDQLLFLRSEDFKANIRRTMETVFNFLGLDPVSEEDMKRISDLPFQNTNNKPVGPMLPKTKQLLKHFLQPFIHRTAQLLDDPRFLWEDV